MSNSAKTSALDRINAVLDDNSFVEVGSRITAMLIAFAAAPKGFASRHLAVIVYGVDYQ